MPNWCDNSIKIKGPKDKIKKIWDEAQKEDKGLLSAIYPMPNELEGTTSPSSSAKKPQPMIEGFDNWYDWRVQNWGTKWDITLSDGDHGLKFIDHKDGEAEINGWFMSAWAPPTGVMDKLLDDHNDIDVSMYYYEGGCDFAGHYDNGSDTEVVPSEEGKSDDWLEASRDTVVGQLDELFGIGETLANYEDEEETEAETKVRELVVEKKAQNMPDKETA
jgi:hypothetical protein